MLIKYRVVTKCTGTVTKQNSNLSIFAKRQPSCIINDLQEARITAKIETFHMQYTYKQSYGGHKNVSF